MKPGWQTTEFWSSIVVQIITLLTLLHVVSGSDATTLAEAFTKIVQAGFVVVTNAMVVINYIKARSELKKEDPLP